jgi:hypothetical protein
MRIPGWMWVALLLILAGCQPIGTATRTPTPAPVATSYVAPLNTPVPTAQKTVVPTPVPEEKTPPSSIITVEPATATASAGP